LLPVRLKYGINKLVNQRFLIGLVGVVLNDQDQVLVFKHTYRRNVPHGLPSGWLKKHEAIARALPREVKEESGLEVEYIRVLDVHSSNKERKVEVWVLCRHKGGTFRPSDEVTEAGFYALDQLPKILRAQATFLKKNWSEITK